MTDTLRSEFEAWAAGRLELSRQKDGEYKSTSAQLVWQAWQAGAKAEREACAKLCDEFGDDYMQQARGGDQSGASDHKACAATEIADAIRARGEE